MRPDFPRATTAVLVTCSLLVLSLAAPVVAAPTYEEVVGSPSLDLYAPNEELAPGERTELQVYVSNDGQIRKNGPSEFTDRVTTARSTSIEVSAGDAPVDVSTGRYPVGVVTDRTNGPIPISVTVEENATPGTYRLPVQVEYAYTAQVDYTATDSGPTDVEFTDFDRRVTRYLTVRITDSATFEVVDAASDARIGDTGTLELTLRNDGTEAAEDATVTLQSGSADVRFGESGTARRYVGSWAPGESKTLTFSPAVADDASLDTHALTTSVAYKNGNGQPATSASLATGIRLAPEQSFSVGNLGGTVRVGDEGTVTGTVTNEGPVAVDDAVVALAGRSTTLDVQEPEYALGDLAPGESADFSFSVEASDEADPGVRQFSFVVTYTDEDGERSEADPINRQVPVGERRPTFGVTAAETTLEAGSTAAVTLVVTNNGDQPLSNVEAKAFADDPLTLDDDEAFVETLAPGETAELTLELSIGSGALAKAYPLSLDFQYDTPDGETKLSDSYSVAVDVTEAEGGGLPGPAVGFGALVVGLLIGGFVWFRR